MIAPATSQKILQIIQEGRIDESVAPKLPIEDLKRMYRTMVLTRLFDAKSMNMQRQGRIGFYVPSAGQEAAQIGSALAATQDDWMQALL